MTDDTFNLDERDRALAFLTKDGNFRVPCSRYGWDSQSCAAFAWQAAKTFAEASGDPITEDSLDHMMMLVVNNHDDIENMLKSHGDDEARLLLSGMGM